MNMNSKDEIFELVDEEGNVVGQAPRADCHKNPELLHRAIHVLIWTSDGELWLQRRSPNKDIQPNKWDTSVGGHFDLGETPEQAAKREMKEELNIENVPLTLEYSYLWKSDKESELIYTFSAVYDQDVTPDFEEVIEARTWSQEEIEEALGKNIFTPNFELEWHKFYKI
ncbi:MAG: NUDIX domain-containing protein [Bacteriovoracaceae bacterium]|nr:NUDIX domain-containing protein [Bacteriovoracaceae bacterium]